MRETSGSSAAPRNAVASRGRLRELLSPTSRLRSSTWDAPSASFTAIETRDALPDRVTPTPGVAWLVPSFELAEELIARGAESARVAVDRRGNEKGWLQALLTAGPLDPLLPPEPHRFPWRMCVILPTYNESENVVDMVAAVRQFLDTDILIVDDNSPDGTGHIADELAARDERVHVLHREKKEGLGPAYIAGFRWALERDYERLFEMDCDFSHAPWDLPRLAAASTQADLVIGSRYVRGGNTDGWTLPRRLLSRGANLYTKCFLGFRVHDWTGGFRCFHAKRLKQMDLDRVAASGYSFQIEMAWRVMAGNGRVREIPIGFTDRNVGKSKMSRGIAFEAVRIVPTLRWKS